MGIMVYPLFWITQDLYHQQYLRGFVETNFGHHSRICLCSLALCFEGHLKRILDVGRELKWIREFQQARGVEFSRIPLIRIRHTCYFHPLAVQDRIKKQRSTSRRGEEG